MGHVQGQNRYLRFLFAGVFACIAAAGAQSVPQAEPSVALTDAAAAPPTSVAAALEQIAAEAGVIFTGSVFSVTPDASGGATVKFKLEQAIRGTGAEDYTMRVSAWAGGTERFYPGERALYLLTEPSVAGYSAPVMGERGIVPLTGDSLVGNLDLRWIAADVQRSSERPPDRKTSRAAETVSNTLSRASRVATAILAPEPIADVQSIDRDLVLDMLRMGNLALVRKGGGTSAEPR